MSRPRLFLTLGFAVAVLVALSVGTRPSLKAQQPAPVIAPALVGGAFGGDAAEQPAPPLHYLPAPPLTIAETKIRLKLHEKIPMNFPEGTALQDVLKHVRQSTVDQTDFPDGLPIYANPVGLQDADKTLASTIAIEMKGIPLATSLKLALDQLDLAYWIHPDGLVIITNKDSEEIPAGSAEHKILEKLSAIEREVLNLRNELRLLRGVPLSGGMASIGGKM